MGFYALTRCTIMSHNMYSEEARIAQRTALWPIKDCITSLPVTQVSYFFLIIHVKALHNLL